MAGDEGVDRAELEAYRSRVRGCLLGGAIGDALGAPVEFWDLRSIRAEVGEAGVREYVAQTVDGVPTHGRITDDTQMTLFTVEGLIRAGVRTDRGLGFTVAVLHHAYDRWLDTQLMDGPDGERDGWLIEQQWLYSQRAPGNTCVSSLLAPRQGGRKIRQFGAAAQHDSKGCGGVMRAAPVGLFPPWSAPPLDWVYDAGCQSASYTHGHPTGQHASGALAVIVALLVRGVSLEEAVDGALELVRAQEGTEETVAALSAAVSAARSGASAEVLETLGGGWIAEEALAIAVYAALCFPDVASVLDALALSVTHSGDSDSTGAICGNILGALHGETALPPELAFEVEGRGTVLELADDLVYEFTSAARLHGDWGPVTRWTERYPGW